MAECYFPEVAEWFNSHGPEGTFHMMMGRIRALEEKVEGKDRPENPPQNLPAEEHPQSPEGMPRLS